MKNYVSNEQELLRKASQLGTQALAEIYDTHSPGIYRYAMRLLGVWLSHYRLTNCKK